MNKDVAKEKLESGKRYFLIEEEWDWLFPSKYNVRKSDIEGTMEWDELRASIKKEGILEDLDVTPDGAIWDGQRRYILIREIVAEEQLEAEELGEARVERAIPVFVRDLTPEEQIKHSLSKNILRKDVGAHDIARSLSDLIDILGTQGKAAEFLGQSDSWVAERLAVLSTPERKFDKEEKKVIEEKSKKPSLASVPKGKVSTMGQLLSSTGETRELQKKVVEPAKELPRDQLQEVKDEVKAISEETGEKVPPKVVEKKIQEKKAKVKRTINRTFRLDRELNDLLKTAEARGYIEDQAEYVNDLLREGLIVLGLLSDD